MDPPVSNISYMDQPSSIHLAQSHQQTLQDVSGVGPIEITGDGGYYSTSPSQLVYQTAPTSLHTTPNTPTSIPDIILTGKYSLTTLYFCFCFRCKKLTWNYLCLDFSSAADEISRQDLVLTKQLEAELLANESLREGLEPLDFDGLQMLSDSGLNLIPDGVEDTFRLDRS